jgi:hypothetical protein
VQLGEAGELNPCLLYFAVRCHVAVGVVQSSSFCFFFFSSSSSFFSSAAASDSDSTSYYSRWRTVPGLLPPAAAVAVAVYVVVEAVL